MMQVIEEVKIYERMEAAEILCLKATDTPTSSPLGICKKLTAYNCS